MAVSVIPKTTLDYSTLVNGVVANRGNVDVFSGRKISEYSLFLLLVTTGAYAVRASMVVPQNVFKLAPYNEMMYVDSSNVQRWIDVKYVSDTVLNLSCSSNATDLYVYVYGIHVH